MIDKKDIVVGAKFRGLINGSIITITKIYQDKDKIIVEHTSKGHKGTTLLDWFRRLQIERIEE